MENKNLFEADTSKCIGCGLCKKVCPAMLLDLDENGKCFSKPVSELNWYGCWKCQHCLAVCPTGAIRVLGKHPEDSLLPPGRQIADDLDALVANRRSCRHFRQENVDPELTRHLLHILSNMPSGGNKQAVEYTVIDRIEDVRQLLGRIRSGYQKMKERKEYPYSWDEESLRIMESREEQAMNGDMFFCSAPHLFIPHMPRKFNTCAIDTSMALAYFELLANAHGLGTVYLGFPHHIMHHIPELEGILEIPEDHYIGVLMGFGYPEIAYARGVQREDGARIHRVRFLV